MKKSILLSVIALITVCCLAGPSQATLLSFDDQSNLGVSIGGSMMWHGTGGGHLFMESFDNNDLILFLDSSTYVDSFQMNARPWEGYVEWGTPHDWQVTVEAFNSMGNSVWSQQVDLQNYMNWSDWLTINVGTGNISSMVFYATGSLDPWEMGFWPSIDNLVISESAPVPEPSTWLLLGGGLLGVSIYRRKRMKA